MKVQTCVDRVEMLMELKNRECYSQKVVNKRYMKKKIEIEQVLKGLHKLAQADGDSVAYSQRAMSDDDIASVFTVDSYTKKLNLEDLTYKELLDYIKKTEVNYEDVQQYTGLNIVQSSRADGTSSHNKAKHF